MPAASAGTAPSAARSRRRQAVGDYLVAHTLGVGATGKVKLAVHRVSGQQVALKIIRKSLLLSKPAVASKVRREIAVLKLLGGAASQARADAEVDALLREEGEECSVDDTGDVDGSTDGRVPGAGVLALYDVYETEQCILLVLEYCPGGDLFELVIQHGYLSDADALHAFQQLVHALDFAHRQGVTHRDLKLENVLIDANGRLKLADFGMASIMTPGSLLETSCGSPNYCAPEVLSGGLYNGALSDVWSLGIILYAMVTGGLPFDDDNFSRLLQKVKAGIFFIPQEVDPRISSLIREMLQVNPDDRITIPEIMQSPWFCSTPPHPDPKPLPDTPAPSYAANENNSESGNEKLDVFANVHGGGTTPPTSLTLVRSKSSANINNSVSDPVMPIVVHMTELGLGEIPTILRRLKADRPCTEKHFYSRLSAFVSKSGFTSTPLNQELPKSPISNSSVFPVVSVPIDAVSKHRTESLDEFLGSVILPESVASEAEANLVPIEGIARILLH
jgi:serine/threonine protein kinase